MRARADVAASMRVVWVNDSVTHTFEVQSYRLADTRNDEMHLMCVEVES
jgi:head-tail adaptor